MALRLGGVRGNVRGNPAIGLSVAAPSVRAFNPWHQQRRRRVAHPARNRAINSYDKRVDGLIAIIRACCRCAVRCAAMGKIW
jgi:hypothetical protein